MSRRKVKAPRWFEPYAAMGYTLRLGGSGHIQVIDPAGRLAASMSASPSCHFAEKKAEADVRRHHRSRGAADVAAQRYSEAR